MWSARSSAARRKRAYVWQSGRFDDDHTFLHESATGNLARVEWTTKISDDDEEDDDP